MQDEGDQVQTLDKDEVVDIVTNFMACQSSVVSQTSKKVEKIIQKFCSDPEIEEEKHYEFYFNLSQIYLKDDDPESALQYLREAFKKALSDGSLSEDNVKFKVQEMHFLSELYKFYNNIEYATEGQGQTTWYEFSKSIKNNILVELNINSLIDMFDLNHQTFKDVIGSLNWKKFAERIKTQLKENEFLT